MRRRLPTILTVDEVTRLIDAAHSLSDPLTEAPAFRAFLRQLFRHDWLAQT